MDILRPNLLGRLRRVDLINVSQLKCKQSNMTNEPLHDDQQAFIAIEHVLIHIKNLYDMFTS